MVTNSMNLTSLIYLIYIFCMLYSALKDGGSWQGERRLFKSEGYLLLLHENRVFKYITAPVAVLWNVQ